MKKSKLKKLPNRFIFARNGDRSADFQAMVEHLNKISAGKYDWSLKNERSPKQGACLLFGKAVGKSYYITSEPTDCFEPHFDAKIISNYGGSIIKESPHFVYFGDAVGWCEQDIHATKPRQTEVSDAER